MYNMHRQLLLVVLGPHSKVLNQIWGSENRGAVEKMAEAGKTAPVSSLPPVKNSVSP